MISADLLSKYIDQPITTYTASEPFNVHWVDPTTTITNEPLTTHHTTTIDQLQCINTNNGWRYRTSFNNTLMDRFYDTILYSDTQWYKNDLDTAEKVISSEDEINADSIREAMLELLDEVTE